MANITDILKTKPLAEQPEETLTIITMVRQGKNKEQFEMALGVTGRWLELPLQQIKSATEIGVYKLGGEEYKVAELVVFRPKADTVWFDFLGHVLKKLTPHLQLNPSGCGCSSDGDSPSPPVMAMLSFRDMYWRAACVYNGYSFRWCAENGM